MILGLELVALGLPRARNDKSQQGLYFPEFAKIGMKSLKWIANPFIPQVHMFPLMAFATSRSGLA